MTDAHESQASETTSRKHLSDAEILAYTSADPFALTSTNLGFMRPSLHTYARLRLVG